jgi:hypothetical protein
MPRAEGACRNLRFDTRQTLACSMQVRFVRSPRQGGSVALAVDREIELDALRARGLHSARDLQQRTVGWVDTENV